MSCSTRGCPEAESLRESSRQFWDCVSSQSAASPVTCHTWLQITFPFLTCQGSNCLCPSCYWGKYYNLPGNGHCCSFQGAENCSGPSGVYVTSLLSAVICQGILVLLLWSFLLNSELWKQKVMPALKTSAWYRDRTVVQIIYLKSGWPFLTRNLALRWESC